MSRSLYLECYSGISGDMTVAALLDLGADAGVLKRALQSLPVSGFTIEIGRVKKSGLDACDFRVVLDSKHENHDHDMEYLHGHGAAENVHEHVHDNGHTDGGHIVDGHSVDGHFHHEHSHHEHRGLPEILEIIDGSCISARAKETARHIFMVLAEAEAKAHGVLPKEVHFHEVGAVDSIVDIVAVAVCLDDLDITEMIVPVLYEGQGTVRCQHGVIPVPVPAVTHIVQAHGLKLHMTNTQGELVTPTGAAIVAACRTKERLPGQFNIEKVGIGAGKRNYDRPSMLRGMLIREESVKEDGIWKLETNIDDSTGEALGYVLERLFAAGALDVHYIPVYMKKNRPAYQLNVICAYEKMDEMERIIFEETTTIGIRRVRMERTVLEREIRTVKTSLGMAQVKVCPLEGKIHFYPEYESAAKLSRKHGLSFQTAYRMIQGECEEEQERG